VIILGFLADATYSADSITHCTGQYIITMHNTSLSLPQKSHNNEMSFLTLTLIKHEPQCMSVISFALTSLQRKWF